MNDSTNDQDVRHSAHMAAEEIADVLERHPDVTPFAATMKREVEIILRRLSNAG